MFPLICRKLRLPSHSLEQEELHYLRGGEYLYRLRVDLRMRPPHRIGSLCHVGSVHSSTLAGNDVTELYLAHDFNGGLTYRLCMEHTCEKVRDIDKFFEEDQLCFLL